MCLFSCNITVISHYTSFVLVLWKLSSVIGQLSREATQDAGVLTISQATGSDSGVYDCVARDANGEELYESARVSVDQYEALPTASITPERYNHVIFNYAHSIPQIQ